MKKQLITIVTCSLFSLACGRTEENRFTLQSDQVAHIHNCHIKMLNATEDQKPPFVGLKYVCGLPESDLDGWPKEDPKWSTHPTPPLAFTLNVGDCLLLEETFYCVESVTAGEATFKASFKKSPGRDSVITRIIP